MRERLKEKWDEMMRVHGELAALSAEDGAMEVQDYTLTDFAGKSIQFSDVFGEHEHLVLIHNMGFACPYCTLWADGFNGIWRHLESGEYGGRAKFLLLSNDTPEQQCEGAAKRGWTFTMLSCRGTTLFKDLGFTGADDESWWPGVSTLVKHPDGRITRHARTEFDPGDVFCSLFHMFALLPQAASAMQ
jgi:peroxiredoxin